MNGNAGGQLRRAALGGGGADGRLVAGEGDVAVEAGVGAGRARAARRWVIGKAVQALAGVPLALLAAQRLF